MSRDVDGAGVRSPSGRSSRGGGFARATSTWLGAAAGIVMWVVGTAVGRLLLDNAYGPLGYYGLLGDIPPVIGTSAAYSCGAAAGLATFASTWVVAQRSRVALVAFLALGAAVVWMLYPRQMDVRESFWPQPNERFSCTGWTFTHYPPKTSDASSRQYCIGLERRIADG